MTVNNVSDMHVSRRDQIGGRILTSEILPAVADGIVLGQDRGVSRALLDMVISPLGLHGESARLAHVEEDMPSHPGGSSWP